GQQAPGLQIMLRGKIELIALLSELGQLMMRAETGRAQLKRFFPALNALFERRVDIPERLFRGNAGGGIAGLPDPVENPAGLRLLFCFVAEKCKLECDVNVAWVPAHGLTELVASRVRFADLEVRIGEILAN